MTLILYAIPPSLYSAKTRIVLRAKGISWEERHPEGGYSNPEFQAEFPAGTLPAIDHDGFKLSDSEAINEYLNEIKASPALWPLGIRDRAQARFLSRFHDTRLEPAVRALFGHVDPAKRDAGFVATQVGVINTRLEQMSLLIDPKPLLTGDQLSLADCGYPITFTFLELLNEPMALNVRWPEKVARYRDNLKVNAHIATELETYAPALGGWISSVIK
ncbi:MAG: glutathione S-transferase family protein [Hyphomicrobiales bacterium]